MMAVLQYKRMFWDARMLMAMQKMQQQPSIPSISRLHVLTCIFAFSIPSFTLPYRFCTSHINQWISVPCWGRPVVRYAFFLLRKFAKSTAQRDVISTNAIYGRGIECFLAVPGHDINIMIMYHHTVISRSLYVYIYIKERISNILV